MAANINSETGIPYGAVSGNSVPWLTDEIFTNGDSLTYASYKSELAEEIKTALVSILEDRAHNAEKIVDSLDIDEIIDSILDSGLNDQIEFDEEEHEYSETVEIGGEKREVKYLQSFLGGGVLIWVTESPYLARAPQCSPCVPGAGDLDNIYSPGDSGDLCYCVPPDAFQQMDGGDDDSGYSANKEIEIGGRKYWIVTKDESTSDED